MSHESSLNVPPDELYTVEERPKVVVINNFPWPSSIYTVGARNLSDALPDSTEVVNIMPHISLLNAHTIGRAATGLEVGPSPLQSFVNFMAPRLTHRQLLKFLQKRKSDGWLVHYTSPYINPIDNDPNNIVTMYENPFLMYSLTKNILTANKSLAHRLMDRYAFKKFREFRNIITCSNYVKTSLEQYGVDSKITTIYPCVGKHIKPLSDKVSIRKELNLPLDKKLILHVSESSNPNIIDRKNAKTVSALRRSLPSGFCIVKVGKRFENELAFTAVDDETINKIYNACDALLAPSIDEGFGLPVIEALATGLPVVASNIDVFKEIAAGCALFIDPLNVQDILHGLLDVLNDPTSYVAAGLKRVKLFSLSEFSKNMNQYYSRIVTS